MDFKQIEAFVNVVRYKSFSRAADATFFTQPTISTHISILEKELGTKLLERKGRIVEMTPQGAQFYKYALEMVNTRARAIEALDKDSDKVEGVLEIQTSSIPGMTFLPEMLAGFRKEHKKTKFYVYQSDSAGVVDNILERIGELGFVGERSNNPNLEYHKIFTDHTVLVVPSSMEPASETMTFEQIVALPFVWRENGSATRKSFEEAAIKRGYARAMFETVALFNDLDAIIRSVEEGLGVSILSEQTVRKINSDRVRTVRIDGFDEIRNFYMVNLKGVVLSPVAEAFKDYVKANRKI
ncbi:MAG: LysR family transcriptional regulator [Mogibacterium sp.]|nr:LysR family transcriptional regulator [Mogibacterium sp.]